MSYSIGEAYQDLNSEVEEALEEADYFKLKDLARIIKKQGDDEWAEELLKTARKIENDEWAYDEAIGN